jgi:hypothetical protein
MIDHFRIFFNTFFFFMQTSEVLVRFKIPVIHIEGPFSSSPVWLAMHMPPALLIATHPCDCAEKLPINKRHIPIARNFIVVD